MPWFRRRSTTPPPVVVSVLVPTPVRVFGVATETFGEVATFNVQSGKSVNLYSFYSSWFWDKDLNSALCKQINAAGYTPMITWEPWEPNGNPVQPAYKLSTISSGSFDSYLTRWATQIKALPFTIYLRPLHEMNGDWYPWGNAVNGNAAGDYIAAWKHIKGVFNAIGVTNVKWVWSPNVDFPILPYYPGADQVDFIALDGYNWGGNSWQSPEQVFGRTLDLLKPLNKPVFIGETGCPQDARKPQWITDFFTMLTVRSLFGFVWFNYNKEYNWRTDSSAASLAAFKKGIAT